MRKLRILFVCLLMAGVATLPATAQKYEGLARTPQMGWNTWNKFADKIDEQLIRSTADALVESGLRDAGYIYLNMDDCWHSKRDSLGFITCDPERFPSGIKALADYVHSKGLKLGIYSDAGRQTCGGRPGSFGHEYQDALQYARWGIDYLKYDWCESYDINAKGAYGLMSEALREAGRPILFSMCEWGSNRPWEWAKDVAHSWRTTGDIWAKFDGTWDHGNGFVQNGVLQILDMNEPLRQYAGPGHWNDPDMLEVGNGLTPSEDRAHFTMWCMMAAPLILGNDIVNMSPEVKAVLMNRDVIAIDQDTLGIQGMRVERGDVEVWLKPLAGSDWAFCLLNRTLEPLDVKLDWRRWSTDDSTVSGRKIDFESHVYELRDLWAKNPQKVVGTTARTKKVATVQVGGHDVVLYRLTLQSASKK